MHFDQSFSIHFIVLILHGNSLFLKSLASVWWRKASKASQVKIFSKALECFVLPWFQSESIFPRHYPSKPLCSHTSLPCICSRLIFFSKPSSFSNPFIYAYESTLPDYIGTFLEQRSRRSQSIESRRGMGCPSRRKVMRDQG